MLSAGSPTILLANQLSGIVRRKVAIYVEIAVRPVKAPAGPAYRMY
jgi:hypothetical protein